MKRLIKDHRENINTTDKDLYTPLHRAAYSNHNIILKLLLQYGADVNARTVDDWTPLHSACKWGNLECVRPLVRAGCDINATSNSGQTPLHLAASNSRAGRTLKYLLRQPRLLKDLANSLGNTARDIAVRSGPYASLFDTVQQKSLEENDNLEVVDQNEREPSIAGVVCPISSNLDEVQLERESIQSIPKQSVNLQEGSIDIERTTFLGDGGDQMCESCN